MEEGKKPLVYIKEQMSGLPGESFLKEWRGLSRDEQNELKGYALEEMEHLGIPIAE